MKESNKQRAKRENSTVPKEVTYSPYGDEPVTEHNPASFLWITLAVIVLIVVVL